MDDVLKEGSPKSVRVGDGNDRSLENKNLMKFLKTPSRVPGIDPNSIEVQDTFSGANLFNTS